MPGMDGWVLARTIQADSGLTGIRLIILTSAGLAFGPGELRKAGIDAFLIKPVKQSRLIKSLAGALHPVSAPIVPIKLSTSAPAVYPIGTRPASGKDAHPLGRG